MAAVLGAEDELVAAVCAEVSTQNEHVQVANYNCPGQVVISGARPAVDRAVRALEEHGIKRIRPLDVSIAAHSRLMQPAVTPFRTKIEEAPLHPPRVPVVANLTARPITTVEEIRAELIGQLTGPVRWTETIEFLVAEGVQRFVEIGPGTVLTGLVKRIARDSIRINIGATTHD
jgi:[acyl-carrier-protein] S-malonyltransferase